MAWTERYVDPSANGLGDGTTTATSGANGAWTWAQMLASASSGQRVNVKAGAYSRTTSNDAFTSAGTTTAPIWVRGYNTTPGDIDTNFALTCPAITYTTGQFRINKSFYLFTNLSFSGAPTATGVLYPAQAGGLTAVNLFIADNVSVENTSANAGAVAVISDNSHASIWSRCRFKATGTAAVVCDYSAQASKPAHTFAGCVFTGGGDGIRITGTTTGAVAGESSWTLYKCCFRGVGGHGIVDASTSPKINVLGCSFKPGSDGYRATATRAAGQVLLADNAFGDCGGYGAQQNTGTGSGYFYRVCNYFFSNTSGNENGFGDTPSLGQQTDSSDKYTSSTDLTLAAGAAGRAAGVPNPGPFNGESFSSYPDIGAVQHPDAGGGGTLLYSVE
jgi:hypothetical protein